ARLRADGRAGGGEGREEERARREMTLSQKRLLQLFAFLAAWAIVVVARLVQIQLVRHADYVARAQRQQERTIELAPVRGAIRDARGRILAESIAAESIYADPQAVVDPAPPRSPSPRLCT